MLHAEEAITVGEALEAYTRGAAYAAGCEDEFGTIAPGRIASLSVLGFNKREVAYILLGELTVLTIVALPVGCLFGYCGAPRPGLLRAMAARLEPRCPGGWESGAVRLACGRVAEVGRACFFLRSRKVVRPAACAAPRMPCAGYSLSTPTTSRACCSWVASSIAWATLSRPRTH